MNIHRDLIAINPFSRPGIKLIGVKAIVIHWVESPGATAKQCRDYFDSLKNQCKCYASAHYAVGISGEAVQIIPADEMAYHVGAPEYTPAALARLGSYPNNCTLGIELCHPTAAGFFTDATLASARELCAMLCAQHGLDPIRDIWTHNGVTWKCCPKWFVDNPAKFEGFKQGVAQETSKG
jgi:N-acetylmuramoyl-L-alanine amidase